MGHTATAWSSGEPLHGELAEGTSAAAGLEIPLYGQNGRRHHIGLSEQLQLIMLKIVETDGGDGFIFADYAGRQDIDTATAGSTDTFTVAGDLTNVLGTTADPIRGVKTTFYVQGSTGNDGEYTVASISYDLVNDLTTIGVAAVADGTDDGVLAWLYYEIAAADDSGNTLTIAGDRRAMFRVGRLFKVDGSTGNDNSGNNYTVTNATYDSDLDQTTVSVSSVADGTDDGYIIPQPTAFAGQVYAAGDYAANGGISRSYTERVPLLPGLTLFGDAAAGNVDFEAQGFLKQNLNIPPAAALA